MTVNVEENVSAVGCTRKFGALANSTAPMSLVVPLAASGLARPKKSRVGASPKVDVGLRGMALYADPPCVIW